MNRPQVSPALAPVWRALADPTRREILDLLRHGPLTTGDLAERFSQSRFGIMKHLGILVDAGLVLVRREGRRRWNVLNPMPIHEIYRRWIRPFESGRADRLMRLRAHAETSLEEDMVATEDRFDVLDINLELDIDAPPATVWNSLTEQVGEWWPEKFYVGDSPIRFTMEGHVGGRVYEDWGEGEGALWAIITVYKKHRQLQWIGDMSPDFGGPARSVTTFTLERSGEGTRLSFRDTPYGRLSPMVHEHLEQGWRWLLNDCLLPWIESGKRPDRPPTVK